jgi:vacuolar protein sorting-associated protein 13A/C
VSKYTLTPHSHLYYAWDFPATRDKKLSLTINGARRLVNPMEIGDLIPFKFHVGHSIFFVQLNLCYCGRTVNEHELYHWMFA